jgi:hypothetical protein
MEGFSDLVWLLIMFLVITRGLSAARKGKKPPQPPPPTEIPQRSSRPASASRPSEQTARRADQSVDQIQSGPGQKSRGAKRSDPVTEFRRRLVEAAREWEAEQRRRAGVPIEDLPGTASQRPDATTEPGRQPSRPRPHPPARPAEPRKRSSWEARDVTPDRVAGQLAERGESPERDRVPARRPRHQPEPETQVTPPSQPARAASLTPAKAAEVEPRAGDVPGRERHVHEPLARLERFRPLKRAVVLAEILGLPKSQPDDPSLRGGARRGPNR